MTPTMPMPTAELDYPVSFPENLPFDDGIPMDSGWHRSQMNLLIHILETNWKGRNFFCGGNMFVHYSAEQVRNKKFLGPDFFVVLDVEHDRLRKYWGVWEESGRYPNVIVELISPTTADEDRTTKKSIYEKTFGTREYFCYDPDDEKLEGWRLSKRYRSIPLKKERMWSEELEMWLGPWQGTWDGHEAVWLRFFDKDGKMLPTGEEAQAAIVQQLLDENESLRALLKQATKS